MVDRPAESAGPGQRGKENGAARFHRLGLVWLVHQTPQRSLLQAGVRRIRQEEPGAGGSGLPEEEKAGRGTEKGERGAAAEIQDRGLSHDHCAEWRRQENRRARLYAGWAEGVPRGIGKGEEEGVGFRRLSRFNGVAEFATPFFRSRLTGCQCRLASRAVVDGR